MQLSGLLEKLKGLFTPAFLLSSVTPLFCFVLVNAAILGQFSPAINQWVRDYFVLGTTQKTVIAAVIAMGLLVAAYVFSTFNILMREKLEGVRLLPILDRRLRASETKRLEAIEERFDRARVTRRQLIKKSDPWLNGLRDARQKGSAAEPAQCTYPATDPVHTALNQLADMRRQWISLKATETQPAAPMSVAALQGNIDQLSAVLETNSADLTGDDSVRLDHDHSLLLSLIEFAQGRANDDYIQLFNEKEFNFSRYRVAPTRMGNIAESIRSYALSRYGINLVFFWTRFQKVLQGKSDFYKTLQDAKTQLDFTVSLFWLTCISTAWWLIALPFLSESWLFLFAVWLLGPLLARLWYIMGVENYRSFADLLRSSLDLFRFDLLSDLKVAAPPNSEAEAKLWDQLNARMSYGDKIFIPYKDGRET